MSRRSHDFKGRQNFSKRERFDLPALSSDKKPEPITPCVGQLFKDIAVHLDTKNDKYERLVKASRDVTIESKRIIFLLHRTATCHQDSVESQKILTEAEDRLHLLRQSCLKARIALELKTEIDPHQFHRAFSPGLQEYIEAVSLAHYIRNSALVPFSLVKDQLVFDDTETNNDQTSTNKISVVVTVIDYIMGIADLTGELMRLSMFYLGAGDVDTPKNICQFMSRIYSSFVALGGSGKLLGGRAFWTQVRTMQNNLLKVEKTAYTIQLRGTEVPKDMLGHIIAASLQTPNRYDTDAAGEDRGPEDEAVF